jgi:hypothetical protein
LNDNYVRPALGHHLEHPLIFLPVITPSRLNIREGSDRGSPVALTVGVEADLLGFKGTMPLTGLLD